MDIKDFLEQDEVRELIAAGNLEAVYEKYIPGLVHPSFNRLSEYLFDLGINPLDYFKNYIPYDAFWGYKNLTSADILDSVTKIGPGAFAFCDNLTDVRISNNVVDIGHDAFNRCINLTSINIPDTVTDIGPRAFYGCSSLASVVIGENSQLTTLGNSAFGGCISLTSITIPESVSVIENYAFEFCTSLMDVYYKGTKDQWEKIEKKPIWSFNSSISVIHCVDGQFVLEF